MPPLRVAELLGSLSLAMDLADGFALEKCLRTTVLASRLARITSGTTEDRTAVFWATLLRFLGCTAFAHEEGPLSGGDDLSLRRTLAYVDFGRPSDFVVRAVRGIAPHAPAVARVRAFGRLLRGNFLMQNFLGLAPAIQSGVLRLPTGSAPGAIVDTRDIADAAAGLLTSREHAGRTYTLTGPQALSHAEVAETLSRVLERRVEFADIPARAFEESCIAAGLPSWFAFWLAEV